MYPEDDSAPQSTKKPVVIETYDEIVFSEPTEAFFARVQNHPAAVVPRLPPGLSLPPPGIMQLSLLVIHIFNPLYLSFVRLSLLAICTFNSLYLLFVLSIFSEKLTAIDPFSAT